MPIVFKTKHEQIKELADDILPGMSQQDLEQRRPLFWEFLSNNGWQRYWKFKGLTADEVLNQVLSTPDSGNVARSEATENA
ncbi:uncharacterized protein BDZ99DRAFT_521476 [Mytilinidion resinicola]|uniref:Uncharacterized protein n=1 Tax=Mytilinidion resinicola TaxID=574789 RepID=A0A6A6YKD6_9PEZI|nr:uncharacterized protein BDZ99DRAFT_521476 [Mytilinidion resinicola]KAF2809008.1 hypothetical protein BDZ99DRAFT_521476 [Mytilinidion resinicola]